MNWRLWTWNDVVRFSVFALLIGGLFCFFVFVPHYTKARKSLSDCIDLAACNKSPASN
jgi:hypothetical protein